jgi:hypothetical protein
MGFGLMTGFTAYLDTARNYTVQFTITHTSVNSHVFTAVAWQRLPMADVGDRVRVSVTLRLAVYRQSVLLGTDRREVHEQRISFG